MRGTHFDASAPPRHPAQTTAAIPEAQTRCIAVDDNAGCCGQLWQLFQPPAIVRFTCSHQAFSAATPGTPARLLPPANTPPPPHPQVGNRSTTPSRFIRQPGETIQSSWLVDAHLLHCTVLLPAPPPASTAGHPDYPPNRSIQTWPWRLSGSHHHSCHLLWVFFLLKGPFIRNNWKWLLHF